jgi:hypothetical protein
MSDKTIRWKLFPFTLKGKARNGTTGPKRRWKAIGELFVQIFAWIFIPYLK